MIDAVGSEAAYDELLTKSHGNRCLIILEGLDEISAHWQQNDTMFCQLVKTTTFLSHANILVTSRPHACIYLYKDIKDYARMIEIVGFDKPQIKEYAELYFHNSNTAEKFMEQINNDPHISSLCYVPLCLNMVLECFKYNNKILHTTLTELYQSFIISKIVEHIHFKKAVSLGTILKDDEQILKILPIVLSDVPNVLSEEALKTLFLLSKLAYKSYFEWSDPVFYEIERNPKIIFTEKDLAYCNITNSGNDACGLLKATNTLFATGNTAVYTFNHLSVQEYFCALYISLLPEDQQLQLLKDHVTDHPHMWPFYAGVTKLRESIVLQYLQQYFLKENQLAKTNVIDYKTVKITYNFRQTIIVLNSIYEAQLLLHVDKYEVSSLFITGHNLHPYDCMSISFFVSVMPITYLYLRNCSIGDQEAEMLARYKDLIFSLKVLDLSYNDVTYKGMKSVVAIIKSSSNLTHLLMDDNPVGDDGIQLFSLLTLEHLIKLNIRDISMTEIGTYALGEYLKFDKSLQSLKISDNYIEDNGLTGILHSFPSALVRLIVTKCCLTSTGAVNISKMLSINKTLKHLEISNNPIGDDGISAISDGLHVNTTLIQLVARNCKFYSKGAKAVAKMLLANKALKYLDISNNHIGDHGITAVTCSIQVNTTLIELVVYECEFHSKGLESVNEMLMVKSLRARLGITYNYAEDADLVVVLETFLKSNCKLSQLNIAYGSHDESKLERCIANVYFEKFIMTSTEPARWTKCHYTVQYNNEIQHQIILKVRYKYSCVYSNINCITET